MKLKDKLIDYLENQKLGRITRKIAKDYEESNQGYVVAASSNFIVLQETEDFALQGFCVFPMEDITTIKRNKFDKYYGQIIEWEGLQKNIGLRTNIELKNWKSVFTSLQKQKSNVIVECEHPEVDTFTIGEIEKVTDKHVYINYFDAAGYVDAEPTKLRFDDITKVVFDDQYIDIFSKYLRKGKEAKK